MRDVDCCVRIKITFERDLFSTPQPRGDTLKVTMRSSVASRLLVLPLLLLFPRARAAEPGIAVAPLDALEVEHSTAVILTGVAEGVAMEAGGRFVAHGELLRTVDAGDDRGCRTEICLARAAKGIGARLLLTGEVGKLENTYVVKVQLSDCPDGETRATVSRQCADCSEGALPALLEDALLHALRSLDGTTSQPRLEDDGQAIVLGLEPGEGSFHYKDPHRTLSRTSALVEGIELSSLTRSVDSLGCLEPGSPPTFTTTLLVHNGRTEPTSLDGTFEVEVFTGSDDAPQVSKQIPVHFDLGGVHDEDGAGDDLLRIEVEVPPPKDAPEVLHILTSWDGEKLEELVTRPVGRVASVEDFYLRLGETRVGDLAWGQEMQAHVHLFKFGMGAPGEVTLRVERKIRYWFDTENTQAFFEFPSGADGSYHLVLPFTPSLGRRDSTEGYSFEVWVNGCQLHRSNLYQ